ncbi:MAG: hypothetical protein MK142_14260, partial [Pseudomonadales bacterium]|nr:hypothetical protein [Pseudomonadales bacterium]
MRGHDDLFTIREASQNGGGFSAKGVPDDFFANQCALPYVNVGSGGRNQAPDEGTQWVKKGIGPVAGWGRAGLGREGPGFGANPLLWVDH